MSTLKSQALHYHQHPRPGKTALALTKSTASQQDLSLAYTPGVAEPVLTIHENPENAYLYTNKSNLVAVISNGTAILGLGNLGALASKPVMEGKAVLFKKFADIDVFDIEVDTTDPGIFIEAVRAISPTFGGINLEDIKAPECFMIEETLKERLNIPVFHDDQHGTAVVIGAALLNAAKLQNKKFTDLKVVCLGAGAAGIATMRFLLAMGIHRKNIYMLDRDGVIHIKRTNLNAYKALFAQETNKRTLEDVLAIADVFIGVSGADLVAPEQVALMPANPIIFALSNPNPEIHPDKIRAVRNDAIIATGRSDMPNQVNNVLCFPYIFRGALDVRARTITTNMMLATAYALSEIAHEPVPQEVLEAYQLKELKFGKDYLIPKPLDPRLATRIPQKVAEAAIKDQVATKI
jgi:malate dehydrogenase (oxaloacetate-decarboxylating)(NADP+)